MCWTGNLDQRLCALILMLPLAEHAAALIIHVPAEYSTVQEAVEAAADGDEVIVAPGRYVENIDFGGRSIILRSRDPLDANVVTTTVLDGGRKGSVVTFTGDEGEACVLAGFTITRGSAFLGAGIRSHAYPKVAREWPVIECNVIMDNLAKQGGGIHGFAGTVRRNVISRNGVAAEDYPLLGGAGMDFCAGIIEYNVITENHSTERFGVALSYCTGYIRGNIIMYHNGDALAECYGPMISDNIIAENDGHAVHNFYGSSTPICNNIIWGFRLAAIEGHQGRIVNNVILDSSGRRGYALRACAGPIQGNLFRDISGPGWIIYDTGDVVSNLFLGCRANYGIGRAFDGNVFANNTLYGNQATDPAATGVVSGSITNCIVWGNVDANGQPTGVEAGSTATYSCIENDVSGEPTNISLDPKFVDPENGDFSLQPDSPCIDAGAYVPEAALDILGRPRGFDGSPEPRGDGSDFDIGAFEFFRRVVGEGEGEGEAGLHSADLDGNWRISMHELLRVIQFYNAHGYGCAEGTEDGYAPGREAESPQRHKEHRGITEDTEQRGWVNPLEVTRSPLVEAYMKKHGIKLPEIPEQHIKLWRAWVTKQSTTQTKVQACAPHSSDYAPQDWHISITELLRIIQFFNAGAYHRCDHGEDGFCPGAP